MRQYFPVAGIDIQLFDEISWELALKGVDFISFPDQRAQL